VLFEEKKGIIFDLDQTLVDTSDFESLRDSRQWQKVYEEVKQLKISTEIIKLIISLNHYNWKIMVVSSAQEDYVNKVLDRMNECSGDKTDYCIQNPICNAGKTAYQKRTKYQQMLEKHNIKLAFSYAVGDRQIDIDAANELGIVSIAANWFDDRSLGSYDLAFDSPNKLLDYFISGNGESIKP